MTRLFLFCSLLLLGQPLLSAQIETTDTIKTDTVISDTTKASQVTANAKLKASRKSSMDIPLVYIYKLKHRKLKMKFWYHPNQNVQPLDHYIAKGWEVVKIKKINAPNLMENIVSWGKIILPIVEPFYSAQLNKEKNK